MATFTAIKGRGKGSGAMGGVMQYVQQKKKTLWEGQQLVTGYNCTSRTAYLEMQMTKQRFHKTDGRQYYHFVQSFSEQDHLTPQEAHAIGLEFAQKQFPDFEVIVATHVDTDNLHNHLVVNSVSYKTGMKLHQNAADLQQHRQVNDMICQAHGLNILPPAPKQVRQKRMSSSEYRAAAHGQSWKFRLMNTIDECMRYAWTKEDFISLMEGEGYQVRWTDSRKAITYTTPDGLKCRDDRLHDEKYLKEAMEREFRIRAEIIPSGIKATEHEAGTASPGSASNAGGLGRVDGEIVGNFPEDGAVEQQILSESNTEAEQRDAGYSVGDEPEAGTGWEEERAALLASQVLSARDRVAAGGCGGHDAGRVAHDLVVLAKRVEDMQQPEPVSIPSGHIDKKRWKELQRKRLAAGHNPDDHVDEPVWQQKM